MPGGTDASRAADVICEAFKTSIVFRNDVGIHLAIAANMCEFPLVAMTRRALIHSADTDEARRATES